MAMLALLGFFLGQNECWQREDRWSAKGLPHDKQPVQYNPHHFLHILQYFRTGNTDHAEEISALDFSTRHYGPVGDCHDNHGLGP